MNNCTIRLFLSEINIIIIIITSYRKMSCMAVANVKSCKFLKHIKNHNNKFFCTNKKCLLWKIYFTKNIIVINTYKNMWITDASRQSFNLIIVINIE